MTQPELDKLRAQVNRLRMRMRELALATSLPLETCAGCGKPHSAVGVVSPKCLDCSATELDALVGMPVAGLYIGQLKSEGLVARLMLALAVRKIEKDKKKETGTDEKDA